VRLVEGRLVSLPSVPLQPVHKRLPSFAFDRVRGVFEFDPVATKVKGPGAHIGACIDSFESMRYVAFMEWTKESPDQIVCKVAPNARFTLKATRMADLRWSWMVYAGAAVDPMASGIVSSLGAAKHVMESFLKKKGYL
jgi:hypothetical protein